MFSQRRKKQNKKILQRNMFINLSLLWALFISFVWGMWLRIMEVSQRFPFKLCVMNQCLFGMQHLLYIGTLVQDLNLTPYCTKAKRYSSCSWKPPEIRGDSNAGANRLNTAWWCPSREVHWGLLWGHRDAPTGFPHKLPRGRKHAQEEGGWSLAVGCCWEQRITRYLGEKTDQITEWQLFSLTG